MGMDERAVDGLRRIATALEALASERHTANQLTMEALKLQERSVSVQEKLATDSLELRSQLEEQRQADVY